MVRSVISALRALEHCKNWGRQFMTALKGFGDTRSEMNDYGQGFLLGSLEAFTYPALIASGNASYIAAWLALKTVPIWREWNKIRSVYNRFLIGNALVVIASYFLGDHFFIQS